MLKLQNNKQGVQNMTEKQITIQGEYGGLSVTRTFTVEQDGRQDSDIVTLSDGKPRRMNKLGNATANRWYFDGCSVWKSNPRFNRLHVMRHCSVIG